MSSKTLSTFDKPAKVMPNNLNYRFAVYDPATMVSATLGTTMDLFQVPNGMQIVDGYVFNAGAEDVTLNLRRRSSTDSSTLLLKLCSASAAGLTRIGIEGAAVIDGVLGYKLSVTATTKVMHHYVQAVVASASMSLTTLFSLSYMASGDN